MPKHHSHGISFGLDQWEMIKERAEREGVSYSQWVREGAFLRMFLEDLRENPELMSTAEELLAAFRVIGPEKVIERLQNNQIRKKTE